MATITKDQATESARRALVDLGSKHELVLQEDRTVEKDFGWVFFPIARRYLETKNRGDLVPGIGPIAVDRTSGAATFLPTSVSPSFAIEEYERQWRERVGAVNRP
jgi:hypothetical protein